ncbi:hypothetical protein [Jeotgalibacillus proteolyticus]|uniref:hypothetical protein n=1 Tax=Jeotgalibacillus proteolyticus TaxID=2082395 RepID=UPI003CF4F35C
MKTIVYYISDYGFGHCTRSIAVIREIFAQAIEPIKMIVCHSYGVELLKVSLLGYEIEFKTISTDVGYVLQKDGMDIDKTLLKETFRSYMQDFPSKVEKEKDFLIENKVDLVLSDISSLPFIAAKQLDILSVGISNLLGIPPMKI